MAVLAFKKPFKEAILDGRKLQTLRKASSIDAGDVVDARCEWGKPAFARLHIHNVTRVGLHQLTEDDAAAEGFESVAEMQATLASLYPGETNFVRLRFAVEPTSGA